jgi:RNA polymerase sigma factor for flagellar operon FliA
LILKSKKKYSEEEKQVLWSKYRNDRNNLEIFNELLEAYIPLLEVIASKTKASLPPHIEFGDLLNDGFFGLVNAVERYDETKGWKFETYASNRIRGEINDRLRDYDWVSRYSRLKFKQVSQTESFLVQELQRQPSMQDIADRLGWEVEEVSKVQASFNSSYSVNIDEYISDSMHETFSLGEMLADESAGQAGFDLDVDDLTKIIERHMFSLPEHESIVVFLSMYENMSFEEIAEVIDAKPSKVSKIFDQAISRLRETLGVY